MTTAQLEREIFAAIARMKKQPYYMKRLLMIQHAVTLAEGYKNLKQDDRKQGKANRA